jgi:hypothetical protein
LGLLESLETNFLGKKKILKFFDAYPGSGTEKIKIRDPGWNKFRSGIREGKNSDPRSGMEKIQIRDSG